MAGQPEILARCLKDFEEDSKSHDQWVNRVDRWYRAWRGVVERNSRAGDWRHQLYPPYLLQIVETLVAGTVDPSPKWMVKPRPRMASLEEIAQLRDGAKALEYLLTYQRDMDRMIQKQRTHRLQGLIAGLTLWKTYWRYSEKTVKKQQSMTHYDEAGAPFVQTAEVDVIEPHEDEPCVEVVDVRDFIWHEAARDIQSAKRLTHRVWMTYEELKALERDGYYSNVSQLKESRSFTEQLASRETDLFNADRTKDMIEVLECWTDGGKRVVTIGNRNVVLRDRKNPFDHGMYPFIASSPIPDLFRIPGISVVELVVDLQEMLWNLQGQRHENLELINNAIVLIREDTLDANSFVFAPGEQWLVPDENAVKILEMPTFPAQVSVEAEQLIKADIQNIPGASPALLGQAGPNEQTATEVSLLSNLAQRRLAQQKWQFTVADIEVGEHWIELNKQFLTEERFVAVVGADGEEGWELIRPESFKHGNFSIDIGQMDESLVRQERLAEAQARFQVALQAVPAMAAIGTPLNMVAFLEDMLEAAGVQDKERYLSASPQPAVLQQQAGQGGQMGGGQGMAPTPEDMMSGATSPLATSISSPSNPFSQSPVANMQRLLSSQGGAVNQ